MKNGHGGRTLSRLSAVLILCVMIVIPIRLAVNLSHRFPPHSVTGSITTRDATISLKQGVLSAYWQTVRPESQRIKAILFGMPGEGFRQYVRPSEGPPIVLHGGVRIETDRDLSFVVSEKDPKNPPRVRIKVGLSNRLIDPSAEFTQVDFLIDQGCGQGEFFVTGHVAVDATGQGGKYASSAPQNGPRIHFEGCQGQSVSIFLPSPFRERRPIEQVAGITSGLGASFASGHVAIGNRTYELLGGDLFSAEGPVVIPTLAFATDRLNLVFFGDATNVRLNQETILPSSLDLVLATPWWTTVFAVLVTAWTAILLPVARLALTGRWGN